MREGGWLNGYGAVVTGGGAGIGRAIVDRYVAEGARVTVLLRSQAQADALRDVHGDRVSPVLGDVRSAADNRAAVDDAVRRWGALDVFVGNAGVYDFFRRLDSFAPDELEAGFDELFAVNVKAYLLGAQASIAALRASSGSMIFTLSSSSFYAGGGGALYVTSKHAAVGLVRQLAYELAPEIRVNAVAPGGTRTDLAGIASAGLGETRLSDVAGFAEKVAKGVPLGFLSEPADHAGHYVLLASRRDSRFTTAAIVQSDGGMAVRGAGRRTPKPEAA
ncbi:3-(cis-5,6-dihydroxycyclohexa-1,3-dien-1-yl)propanoate dehydrogenase [Roseiterribacter gracilis]|uniref:3-phenylpropionate-dihydrodiol/cinnamic acid-dihydrodiol dehydrogenase n=1 Tax=Roseiterribacter gracilis TaxID=2812848 RepID=A0A8S8XD26_9PROT|nr:3-phenylpropionate-dihydrodiol/cinnamic acid-dihydrodiol dehydrogenase [Rhodospirillales bacterium TMPK1]